MSDIIKSLLFTFGLLFGFVGMLQANDTGFEKGQPEAKVKQHCLQIRDIRTIEIVDNKTILFHTYRKEVWKNTLPAPCPGLRMEGGIQYKTSIGKLCDLDIVKVLRLKTPCALGDFEQVTEHNMTK